VTGIVSVELIVRACALVGARPEQVLSYKAYPERGEFALVVDWGVAGGKKYTLALSDLQGQESAPVEPPKRGRGRPKSGNRTHESDQ
jgi:hypothetical protein